MLSRHLVGVNTFCVVFATFFVNLPKSVVFKTL
nr:MAG TPA: hypothetical protein [Caudoviricetes sp.]